VAYVPMALGRTGEPRTPATTLLLAFSMSLDAFAAALSKGAALKGQRLLDALRTGVIFGVIEAITPVIGWAFGFALSMWIREIDHWVAFILLSLIGGRMTLHALRRVDARPAATQHSLALLLLTAFATSVDAMAVGVTLAFVQANILTVAAAIGVATFIMAAVGTLAGQWVGPRFGKVAEVIGGLCLIAIGVRILIEHTLGGGSETVDIFLDGFL
jgi:manganese efflux pump family protein